jgi:hypothetical protein
MCRQRRTRWKRCRHTQSDRWSCTKVWARHAVRALSFCVIANPCKNKVKRRGFQARWTGCQISYSRCTFIMWGQWGADDQRRTKPPSTLSRHGPLVPDHCALFWMANCVCRHPVKRRHIEGCEPGRLNVVRLDRGDVIGKPFWDRYWWNFDPCRQKSCVAQFFARRIGREIALNQ